METFLWAVQKTTPFLRRPSWQMGDLFCGYSLPRKADSQKEQTVAATLGLVAPSFLLDSLCSPFCLFFLRRCSSVVSIAPCVSGSLPLSAPLIPFFPVILEAVNDCLLCSLYHLFPQNPQSCPDMVSFSVFPRRCKYTCGSGLWKRSAYASCCVSMGLGLKCFGTKLLHP